MKAFPRLVTGLREALPKSEAADSWRSQLPRTRLQKAVVLLLVAVFVSYVVGWVRWYWPWLTDPMLQNDDARIQLFAFHRFGPDGALADDEAALDQMAAVPPGFVLLYALLVPLTSLYVAPKLVQALVLAIVFAAGFILAKRKNFGLGLLFVFLLIQSDPVMDRMGGGLPRAFGYPLLALWLSGAITKSGWTRATAVWLGAFFYPSAAAMTLGAEGVFQLTTLAYCSRGEIISRAKRYAFLVATSIALIVPFTIVQAERAGPPITYHQAKKMELFRKSGRLMRPERLPLPDPTEHVGKSLGKLFEARGDALWPWASKHVRHQRSTAALVILAAVGILVLTRASRLPMPAVALVIASVLLYALARAVAFRLYVPERFVALGLPVATLAFVIGAFSDVGRRLKPDRRRVFHHLLAAFSILAFWTFMGCGYKRQAGMRIDGRHNADLYAFARQLPVDSRIAAHIMDGNDLPFWAGRATVTSEETACPWFTHNWERYDRRTKATLKGLYATNRRTLLKFADRYHVTHLLLKKSRYSKKEFRDNAKSFPPYTKYAKRLLRKTKAEDLVLYKPPKLAVVFENEKYLLVDVKLLEDAWRKDPWGKNPWGKGASSNSASQRQKNDKHRKTDGGGSKK